LHRIAYVPGCPGQSRKEIVMEAAQETFTCDRCGAQVPRNQLKEVIEGPGSPPERMELCPDCLDERMNEATEVRGGEGQEKARAAYVDDAASEGSYGRRD
jgi:NAD-dependent SIR2 family protein deacetylase